MPTKSKSPLSIKSFIDAGRGVYLFFRKDKQGIVHLVCAIAVIILGFIMNISSSEWMWVIVACALVFITEMINSVIEKTIDLISPGYHKTAGMIKDMAAGAVLIAALAALLIGLIIFIPKLLP